MTYDIKKIESGIHELMRLRVSQLEESIKYGLQPFSLVSAVQQYREAEKVASTIISTYEHESKVDVMLKEFEENLKKGKDKDYSNKKLEEFNLSVRARKCLRYAGLSLESTIVELAQKTEVDFFMQKNIGDKTVGELRKILTDGGLDFKK